jgi:hypothetical protein
VIAGEATAPTGPPSLQGRGSAALVIAHPGRELRLHHWLEEVRPVVCVLTDGSGSAGDSRLQSTTTVLRRAGAEPGPIYGRFTDREIYNATIAGRSQLFVGLARELETWTPRATSSIEVDALSRSTTVRLRHRVAALPLLGPLARALARRAVGR